MLAPHMWILQFHWYICWAILSCRCYCYAESIMVCTTEGVRLWITTWPTMSVRILQKHAQKLYITRTWHLPCSHLDDQSNALNGFRTRLSVAIPWANDYWQKTIIDIQPEFKKHRNDYIGHIFWSIHHCFAGTDDGLISSKYSRDFPCQYLRVRDGGTVYYLDYEFGVPVPNNALFGGYTVYLGR